MKDESKEFGYIPSLPFDLRPLFKSIANDLVMLAEIHKFYAELFNDSKNFPIFNETSAAAFRLIQEALFTDIIVRLSRLFDPESSCGKENLSLRRLISQLDDKADLEPKLAFLRDECAPVISWRMKLIAHRDLRHALNPIDNPLPAIKLEKIRTIIEGTSQLMNDIVRKYKDTEMMFEFPGKGEAENMIFWLEKGIEKVRKEREALLGEIGRKTNE
jgi:hypothetical protein